MRPGAAWQALCRALLVMMLAGLYAASAGAAHANTRSARAPSTVAFGSTAFVHRWSNGGQHEFTPSRDGDLAHWREMVTINVHEAVTDGEELAALANRVLGNYQRHGKIVRTDSRPRTAERPAEHFAAALLAGSSQLEAAFARFVLAEGVGVVVVYSRQFPGENAAREMGEWVQANGPAIERTLMSWPIPSVRSLQRLPQQK